MKSTHCFRPIQKSESSPKTASSSSMKRAGNVLFSLTLMCLAIAGHTQGQPLGRQVVNQSLQWVSLNSNIKLSRKLGLTLDGQFRFAEFGNMQHMLRAGMDYYRSFRSVIVIYRIISMASSLPRTPITSAEYGSKLLTSRPFHAWR